MNASETLKNHMDAVRGVTGVSGLLNMAMATDALNQVGAFTDHGVISSGSINDLTQAGMYSIQNNVSDCPSGDPWGMLTVFTSKKAGYHYIKQDFSGSKGTVYTRLGVKVNYVDTTWKPWLKLGGVINPVLSAFFHSLKGGIAYVA